MTENGELSCLVSAQRARLNLEGFIPMSFVLMTLVVVIFASKLDNNFLLAIPPALWFFGVPIWDRVMGNSKASNDEAAPEPQASHFVQVESGATAAGLAIVGIIVLVVTDTHSSVSLIGLGISSGLLLALACNSPLANTDEQITPAMAYCRIRSWLFKGLLLIPILSSSAMRRHHKFASTQKDASSARMGESYFAYVRRFLVGFFLQAGRSDNDAQSYVETNDGQTSSTQHTEIVRLTSLAALYLGLAYVVGGSGAVLFLFVQAMVAFWQITATEYAEHYGMLRKQLANAKHELLTGKHLWHTTGDLNNALLSGRTYHLHRPGQYTEAGQDLPRLPMGFNLASIVVLVPPLWFKVMNGRLAEIVELNLHNVNLNGSAYVGLMEKYHRPEAAKA